MNKRLKIVLFVLLGTVLVIGLAIGGFFILRNSTAVVVNNLQILAADGTEMKDTSRFLSSDTTNHFFIDIEMETSSGQKGIYFTSSNPEVAKIVKRDDQYFVYYFNAGSAVITAYSAYSTSVYDSFKIDVYDNHITDIVIAEQEDDHLHVFGDATTHAYNYTATGVLENQSVCNNMMVRVIDNYNKDVFESITINPETQEVVISTNLVIKDSQEVFYLQTYYVDSNGKERITQNHAYYIDVTGYRLVEVQLLMSSNESFSDYYVCLANGETKEDAYLGYNEKVLSNIVLTKSVTDLFFKIRVVYSNRWAVDISASELDNISDILGILKFESSYKANMESWYVSVDSATLEAGSHDSDIIRAFEITYSDDSVQTSIQKEFQITYKFEDSQSYQDFLDKDLYAKVVNTDGELLYYEYIYWDTRYRRTDATTDASGKIVEFPAGTEPNCSQIIISE